ncbi:phosphoenolpyruvate--protein phosphotransferase [Mycoplasmopsis felifaucium]|uniref:Phosphoenolpyruvate-protein phosphotransferase n=1 Tax=Mycoplasmopsis felifaucium TaxID=35768 RepID=A0ABZ2RSR9_9BACT
MLIKGIGSSRGISIAKAFVIENLDEKSKSQVKSVEYEVKLFKKATKKVCELIQNIIDSVDNNESKAIFQSHLQIAKDPISQAEIIKSIEDNNTSAFYATLNYYKKQAGSLSKLDDHYLKERSTDILDVLNSYIKVFNKKQERIDLSKIDHNVIIVTSDITPSQTIKMNSKFIKGFVCVRGGTTSHSSILARSLGIPSVVGCNNLFNEIKTGDLLIIDGSKGDVIVHPSDVDIENYEHLKSEYKSYLNNLSKFINKPTISNDGYEFNLYSNISNVSEAELAYKTGSEGIGLFRTEFIFMNSNILPNEQSQLEIYKKVVQLSNGRKTIFRTLDIGGDKVIKYLNLPVEFNPFLGLRGTRLLLSEQYISILKTQLRALIRASEFGSISIMFPMISCVSEIIKLREIFKECYKTVFLDNSKITDINNIKLGIMIETPVAALNSHNLGKYTDFMSIGSNDLIQYTMAADRDNESVNYLYQPLNPAVLKMFKEAIKGANKNNIPISICGEIAGNRELIPILIGLGMKQFSMNNNCILKIRELISKLNTSELADIALKALKLEDENEIKDLLLHNLPI